MPHQLRHLGNTHAIDQRVGAVRVTVAVSDDAGEGARALIRSQRNRMRTALREYGVFFRGPRKMAPSGFFAMSVLDSSIIAGVR